MIGLYPEETLEGGVVRHELDTHPTKTWIVLASLVWEMHLQWIFCIKAFTVVGLEDDVVGLGEAHDEDEVDDKESEEVFGDHPVDHDHKGADNLNRPGMIL